MGNPWFQFKQFTVNQEKSAMKVCTDSCLFGAWIADLLTLKNLQAANVLDIGTGTGLLSLMLAQKTASKIDAVESDAQASEQANENFEKSLWKDRLRLIEEDIRKVKMSYKYDLIISNPPFFRDDLRSKNDKRNLALHSSALSFDELLLSTKNFLKDKGFFGVLLPFSRSNSFIDLAAKYDLYPKQQVLVKHSERHNFFRAMLLFSTQKNEYAESEIVIEKDQKYSEEFVYLLKDYYLYL